MRQLVDRPVNQGEKNFSKTCIFDGLGKVSLITLPLTSDLGLVYKRIQNYRLLDKIINHKTELKQYFSRYLNLNPQYPEEAEAHYQPTIGHSQIGLFSLKNSIVFLFQHTSGDDIY